MELQGKSILSETDHNIKTSAIDLNIKHTYFQRIFERVTLKLVRDNEWKVGLELFVDMK